MDKENSYSQWRSVLLGLRSNPKFEKDISTSKSPSVMFSLMPSMLVMAPTYLQPSLFESENSYISSTIFVCKEETNKYCNINLKKHEQRAFSRKREKWKSDHNQFIIIALYQHLTRQLATNVT